MQLSINAPKWLVWAVLIGVGIGLVVAALFFSGKLDPSQTKGAIGIGACFWALAAIACWACSVKIEVVEMPPDYDPKPHMSTAEWKRFQDREKGWQ